MSPPIFLCRPQPEPHPLVRRLDARRATRSKSPRRSGRVPWPLSSTRGGKAHSLSLPPRFQASKKTLVRKAGTPMHPSQAVPFRPSNPGYTACSPPCSACSLGVCGPYTTHSLDWTGGTAGAPQPCTAWVRVGFGGGQQQHTSVRVARFPMRSGIAGPAPGKGNKTSTVLAKPARPQLLLCRASPPDLVPSARVLHQAMPPAPLARLAGVIQATRPAGRVGHGSLELGTV